MANNRGSNGGFEVPSKNVIGVSGSKANETMNYMSNIAVDNGKYHMSRKTRFNGKGNLFRKIFYTLVILIGIGWFAVYLVDHYTSFR